MFMGWCYDVLNMWKNLTVLGKIVLFPVWLVLATIVLLVGLLIMGPYHLATKTVSGLKKLLFKAP